MPPGRLRRWFDPEWYRYLGRSHPDRVAVVSVLALGLLAFGGYSAVSALGEGGGSPASVVLQATTVMRTVKSFSHGRVVVKRIAVVKRVAARRTTIIGTHTVQAPAATHLVTRRVVTQRVVRVNGKSVTIRNVVTNTQVLTNTQLSTVVQNQTATVVQTATAPPQTVTITGPGGTTTVTTHVTTTVTVPVTVTLIVTT